jgi:hypothetical protein
MSESWEDYPKPWEDIYIADDEMPFDIAEAFRFPGYLLMQEGHPQIDWRKPGHLGEWLAADLTAVDRRLVKVQIPARWLTHVVQIGSMDEPPEERALPEWAAEPFRREVQA